MKTTLVGSISDIHAACIYPTRNANFKSWISDIRLKSDSFLVSHFFIRRNVGKTKVVYNISAVRVILKPTLLSSLPINPPHWGLCTVQSVGKLPTIKSTGLQFYYGLACINQLGVSSSYNY